VVNLKYTIFGVWGVGLARTVPYHNSSHVSALDPHKMTHQLAYG